MAVGAVPRGRFRRSAFSMIELLLSVGIIVILLGIMLPALKRSVRQARATVCMHNLHVLDQVLKMYESENRGWAPTARANEEEAQAGDPKWHELLVPRYLPDLQLLVCPEDPFANRLIAQDAQSASAILGRDTSYGINSLIVSDTGPAMGNVERYNPKRPLDTLLSADMGPDAGLKWGDKDAVGDGTGRWAGGGLSWDDGVEFGGVQHMRSWLTQRHTNGINALTLGGGVRTIQSKPIMTSTIDSFYDRCAAGGCPLCTDLEIPHYSFYRSRVYWWTGRLPEL